MARTLLPDGSKWGLPADPDEQDHGSPLMADERAKVEGIREMAELLSLLRLEISAVDALKRNCTSLCTGR